MNNLYKEVIKINQRNRRVETDKAWEQSWFRRAVIAIMTYIIAVVWLKAINEPSLLWKAFVPVAGYIFSTLTLPPIKKWWSRKNAKIDKN